MRGIGVLVFFVVACTSTTASTDSPQRVDTDVVGEFYGMLERGMSSSSVSASGFTCGSGGGSTCDTSVCGTTNRAPVLGTPILLVNGYVAAAASIGDHVQVMVPFEDADCNLGCGGVSGSYGTPDMAADFESGGCDDQPCDTATSGVYYAFSLGTLDRAGEHYVGLRVSDACGEDSNRADLDFTL